MKQFKPILKPINEHLMETRGGADELCAVADLLEQAARKLRRIAEKMSAIDVPATKRKLDQQFS
jgi:hypothetical protein